jgi:Trypsin-co-occurring domain 2
MADNITITEALEQLRTQLEDAQRQGNGRELRFLAKSVEVELAVVFRSEKEGGGGVKAWFVDISGKAKTAGETTHRVKLILEPVSRDGKQTLVSDAGDNER